MEASNVGLAIALRAIEGVSTLASARFALAFVVFVQLFPRIAHEWLAGRALRAQKRLTGLADVRVVRIPHERVSGLLLVAPCAALCIAHAAHHPRLRKRHVP